MDSDLPVSRRLCFVGTDNYAAGREMGEQIRQAVPGGGQVVVSIGQPDKENTLRRRQGLIDELCDRAVEPLRPFDALDQPQTGSRYTIVTTLVDHSDPARATELAAEAIRQNPDLTCIAGMLSYSAPALAAAVEQEKASDRVKVIGFDVSDQTLELIEQGKVVSTTMQDQYGLGYHAVRILVDNARQNIGGLPMYQQHALSSDIVNKENLPLVRRRLAGEKVSLATGAPSPSPVEAPEDEK
jgi:ribose transport system substrate-binding protein